MDSIYDAIVSKGVTPASKSLSDIISAIGDLRARQTHTISLVQVGYGTWGNYYAQQIYFDGTSIGSTINGGYNMSTMSYTVTDS